MHIALFSKFPFLYQSSKVRNCRLLNRYYLHIMDNVLSLIVYVDTRALAASHANRSSQFCIVITVFVISSN